MTKPEVSELNLGLHEGARRAEKIIAGITPEMKVIGAKRLEFWFSTSHTPEEVAVSMYEGMKAAEPPCYWRKGRAENDFYITTSCQAHVTHPYNFCPNCGRRVEVREDG